MTSTQEQLKKEIYAARSRKLRDAMLVQIRGTGIPMPISEYQFASPRLWRFDLAWLTDRVALELHGGVYTDGRHTRGRGFTADREKINEAQLLGWTVLEVTPAHIKSGQALEWLARALPEVAVLHRA